MRHLRNIECYLNDATIADAVSSLLYTLNIVNDNEVIVSLTIGNTTVDGVRPINFTCIAEKEPELIIHS